MLKIVLCTFPDAHRSPFWHCSFFLEDRTNLIDFLESTRFNVPSRRDKLSFIASKAKCNLSSTFLIFFFFCLTLLPSRALLLPPLLLCIHEHCGKVEKFMARENERVSRGGNKSGGGVSN